MTTLAVGASGPLAEDDELIEGGETRLRLKREAWTSRIEIEASGLIEALDVNANRLRIALEGSHERALASGATLTPSLELGLRHDGGDGETGAGLEIGGGLAWSDPALGLTVEGRGRALAAHQGAYREWGVSGLVRLAPELGWGFGTLGGRGLLTPYGGFSLSDGGARDYRLGTRLTIAPALSLSLEGTRREAGAGGDAAADHGIMLRGELRF